jgi:hypothetical protein
MVTAIVDPASALLASGALLRLRSQMTFACLAVSHQRIEQSCILIHRAYQAQNRTHALGVKYADWRLRLDIATELRHLMDSVDWH